jgi:signal transduction histidine kinase
MHKNATCAGMDRDVHHGESDRTAWASGVTDPPAVQRLRHDLRQPLAAIRWSVDAADGLTDLPAHLSAVLDQIGRQARWMERLLAEALEAPTEVTVVNLVEAMTECCTGAPPSATYDLSFTGVGEVPVIVDPVGLERAARNLIDNAVRAVGASGRIEVSVTGCDTRGVLAVADSGPGFGALSPRQGHGLVSVRRFVERFGGELAYGTSTLGGALVRLSLPRAWGW